jgi:uncharacterized protein (TIGR00730 family)
VATPSQTIRSLCIFCGAASGHDPKWYKTAHEMGFLLAEAGYTLIYGGGNTGLMGAIAEGALVAKGEVIGIMPETLVLRERAHQGLTELEVVPDMATRKERMIELSDAFISLPGGLGTLDELFEVLTWYQIGLHQKPSFLLNQDGFYNALIQMIQEQDDAGFLHGKLPLSASNSPQALLELINTYQQT